MKKRGQVTLFVILGIVIVVAVGIGLYYSGLLSKSFTEAQLSERELLSAEEKAVATFIDGCVKQTLEVGVMEVARNGGYYPAKRDSTSYLAFNVPLYLDNGKEDIPTIKDIALSLANYVDNNIEHCLSGDLEVLEEAKTKVTVGEVVRAEVEMPVSFDNSKLTRFFAELDVDYNQILDKVNEFYNLVKKFNATMNVLEMGRYVTEKDYDFSYDEIDNRSIYLLTLDVIIENESFVFPLAIRKEVEDDEGYAEYWDDPLLSELIEEEGELSEDDFFDDDEEIPEELLNFTDDIIIGEFESEEFEEEDVLSGI